RAGAWPRGVAVRAGGARVGERFLDRIEIVARDVLDECELEGPRRRRLAHHDRHVVQARALGGPPAPLAGDEPEATPLGLMTLADDERLDEALRADRLGQLLQRLLGERLAWLLRARVHLLDGGEAGI